MVARVTCAYLVRKLRRPHDNLAPRPHQLRVARPHRPGGPLDRRVVLSGLWVSMLFVFAYVDIFADFRADVIKGVWPESCPGPASKSTRCSSR